LSTDQSIIDAVWDHPKSYRKPFTLKPPEITDTNADAVIESTSLILDKIAQEFAWSTITAKVYIQLCPNVVENPAAVIQSIHQVTKDSEGAPITLSVEAYFNSVQRMTNFLPKDDPFGQLMSLQNCYSKGKK
jgi:prophage DNA circulation protein